MAQPIFARPRRAPTQPADYPLPDVAPRPICLNAPPRELRGEFARAAYHGAMTAAARLTIQDRPDPTQVLLTDLYINSAHGIPYTVGDAAAVTGFGPGPIGMLVSALVADGSLRIYRRLSDGDLSLHHRIDLTPARQAALGGMFAREASIVPPATIMMRAEGESREG
ncbi:MAG: hypothetical protein ABW039_05520 [Sphingobium sp.]